MITKFEKTSDWTRKAEPEIKKVLNHLISKKYSPDYTLYTEVLTLLTTNRRLVKKFQLEPHRSKKEKYLIRINKNLSEINEKLILLQLLF
jgi:hypothetical protein